MSFFILNEKDVCKHITHTKNYTTAKYVLKRAVKEGNIKVLIRFPFDMGARFIGMKVGKR